MHMYLYNLLLSFSVPVEEVDIQDMRTGQSVANQTVEILMDSYPAFRCVVRVNGSDVTPNVQVRFGRYDFINKMTKGDEIKTNTSANGLAIMNYSATWEVDRAYNATLDDHKKVLRCSAEMPNGNFGSVQSSATVDITCKFFIWLFIGLSFHKCLGFCILAHTYEGII